MNKQGMIAAMAAESGLTKATCARAIDAQISVANFVLGKGEQVDIRGLVKLTPSTRAGRNARNPRTGERIAIPPGLIVKAKASKMLKAGAPITDSEGGEA